jgi:hypothetical protein
VNFIFRKVPPSDSYAEGENQGFAELSYEDGIDICELLGRIDEDGEIYEVMSTLVDSITCKHRRKVLSTQQRVDIAERLEQITRTKFPNPRFIAHSGYKILASAQVAKLARHRPYPWEQLVLQAKQIPNLSDSVFVLASLAEICTDIDIHERAKVLKEAKNLADNIQSTIDRLYRYETIATLARDVDLTFCRQCIRETYAFTKTVDKNQGRNTQRRLVDLAHGIDSALASSLADSFDDDEARQAAREQIELQEERKRIADGVLEAKQEQLDNSRMSHNLWLLLGKLNANRVEALPVGKTRIFVQTASKMPLGEAYPVFSWVIENAVRRRAQAAEARNLMRGLFEATLVGCDLAHILGGRAAGKLREAVRLTPSRGTPNSFIVHAGERESALAFLRDWIAKNVTGYLKICDPYFGPNDLEALQIVRGSAPDVLVSVVTSKKHQDDQSHGRNIEESFQQQWRKISDQTPPRNEICVIGTPSGELPIHERWWLSRGCGLRFGTSYNSIGGKRESEISVLTEIEAEQREAEINEYIEFKKREHNGQRLSMSLFSIS